MSWKYVVSHLYWLFGAASEDYILLLYELASGKSKKFAGQWFKNEVARAKEIFLSENFQSILDGHLAEEYVPLIEKLKEMKFENDH